MQVLNQLTGLLWQAAPTFFLLLILYFFLKSLFFKPLENVLEERTARIEGARQSAESAQAAAQEKVRAYQEALKKARGEIYAEQDTARRAALDERAGTVREARSRANDTTRAAKERIAAEMAQARQQLERESPALAGEIVRVILAQRPGGSATR